MTDADPSDGAGDDAAATRDATPAPGTTRRSEAAVENGLVGPAPDERPHPTGRRNDQGIRIDPETEAERPPRTAVISALVDNEPGVLANVSGLFRRRQFNIESLTVGPTEDPDVSRMTIVTEEPDPSVRQIEKQLEKLVPVRTVTELASDAIRRELALVKVDGDRPAAIGTVADMYDARTVDVTTEAITVEVTGSRQKVEAAIDAFEQFGVREVKRTGSAALERGSTRTGGEWPPAAAGADAAEARADGGDDADPAGETR
jgi:acetolactate synthase-1/3 small subunit